MPSIGILVRPQTAKANPFTVAIVANPTLEARWTPSLRRDPILSNEAAFDTAARYIKECLFGQLPAQAERFLSDPSVPPEILVVSVFVPEAEVSDATALVREDVGVSDLLVPRRDHYRPFLGALGLDGDVIFAVSGSTRAKRASAYPTTDNDSASGVAFELDGVGLFHRYFSKIPGTIAIHASAASLTALHEFGHALSSYSNGLIADLYTGQGQGMNCKQGRPIPASFCSYDGTDFAADPSRDSLGYDAAWVSYHCC